VRVSSVTRARRRFYAGATAIFVAAFVYRFNALGGPFGGFDNDHFVHFAHARQIMAGEMPLRDFLDVGLQGAWPPLTYYSSIAAQRLLGETLLSEALLCVALLAIGMAVSYEVARRLGAAAWAAAAAALLGIVLAPKLYNYPKVFLPAVALLLVVRVVERDSTWRWAALGAWTAVATLFRNDYGVYLGIAVAVAIVAMSGVNVRAAARRAGIFGTAMGVLLLPAAYWVQAHGGIGAYVRSGLEISQRETERTALAWPVFQGGDPLSETNLLAWIYYAFLAVPILVSGIVALRWRVLPPATRAALLAVATLGIVYDTYMLRANLAARFGDASVPFVICAAWLLTVAVRWEHKGATLRRLAFMPLVAIIVFAATARAVQTVTPVEIGAVGLSSLPSGPFQRFLRAADELRVLPRRGWRSGYDEGTLVAARYVALCTAETDRVLTAGYFAEIPVFARRRFAAGQLNFALGVGEAEDQQRLAIERLRRQSVPIVITAPLDTYRAEFEGDYPLVAEYLAARYRDAGVFDIDGRPRMRVLVDKTLTPKSEFDRGKLPCFR
jgi:hypothetical protein